MKRAAVALLMVLAGCGDPSGSSSQDCLGSTTAVRACDCPGAEAGLQTCTDGEWAACKCPIVVDAGSGADASVSDCRLDGDPAPCWQAILRCYPAGGAGDSAAQVADVCAALCMDPAIPGTVVGCQDDCGSVEMDLGFCGATTCEDLAGEVPADPGAQCP